MSDNILLIHGKLEHCVCLAIIKEYEKCVQIWKSSQFNKLKTI